MSYLRSVSKVVSGSVTLPVAYNIAPTVFYNNDEEDPKLYVFYTNVKNTTQTYLFNPGTFEDLFSGATDISLSGQTINYLNAVVPYSTSGKSTLYDINTWYNCFVGGGTNTHPIATDESDVLDGLASTDCSVGSIPGSACVVVPKYSLGYFILDVDVDFRMGVIEDIFSIYPNPASTNFYIQKTSPDYEHVESLNIEIYNAFGDHVLNATIVEGQTIDISQLPVGVYNVVITVDGMSAESEQLVKMK